MKYVIGVDLGTSAVKLLLMNTLGEVCSEVSKPYPLIQERSGFSEQNPEDWVEQTKVGLAELVKGFEGDSEDIEGISFSGQMHGLVLLDNNNQVLRPAILWNDTRTTKQCRFISDVMGEEKLLRITKNQALEGFTLPKLLWVKENEKAIFEQTKVFLLPKDYVRYKMTDQIYSEYSDAAGTLLLNIEESSWSYEMCDLFGIERSVCPPLVESKTCVGTLKPSFADETGLSVRTKVFAGGADNACGALGAGILSAGKTLCSIGTSGVILAYEENKETNFDGKIHFFNYTEKDLYYAMGVTLSAGHSLEWFKKTFAENEEFDVLLDGVGQVPIGARGLLYTPYLVGERTPHADATIRGSFIGIDASHKRIDFARAVMEGITFSLKESIDILENYGKTIDTVVSIGGGAKNETWLQMQADIFGVKVVKLASEQGPGVGAAMLAAVGLGWYGSLAQCADVFVKQSKQYEPIGANVEKYQRLFKIFQNIYTQTKEINVSLQAYR